MNSFDKKIQETVINLQKAFKDRRYTKYIQGKTVVLVGPDDRLIGQGKGKQIEQHDAIIRLNTTYDYLPFESKLVKDIGKRTDVLYQCPSSFKPAIENPKLLKKKLLENKIKFVNYQNGNRNSIYHQTDKYCYAEHKDRYKKFLLKEPKIKTQLHYSHESCKALSNLLTELGKENIVARTGFLAIWDAIVHGATSIRLEGMSFYHGGGHMFRKIKGNLDPYKNHKHAKSPHNSVVEIELLKRIMRLYPGKVIIGDPNLAKILSP